MEEFSVSESQNLGSVYGPLMRIIESDTLAYRVVFAKMFESPIAAIVLSQYLYWGRNIVSVKRDGWFYKTEADLYRETGVSAKSQRTARKILTENSILLVEKRGVPAKNWYKINYERLAEVLFQYAPPINAWGLQEVPDEDCQYSPKGTTGSAERVVLSITENTTKNTTEISDASVAPIPEQELSYEPEEGSLVKAVPKKTPRAFLNSRRIDTGRPPMQTPRTENKAFDALKWKDYFRDQGYKQHKMQFFLVNSKTREATVTKLMVAAKKAVPDLDFKGLIDWWFENGWGGYEPEICFMGKTIEQFLNRDKGKKSNQQKVFSV